MISILFVITAIILLTLWAVGKVPLRYNLRNLTARWKTTLMTALAFTAVVALLTVMMSFVNGMRTLTNESGQPRKFSLPALSVMAVILATVNWRKFPSRLMMASWTMR